MTEFFAPVGGILRWLLQSLLIAAIFIPLAAILPLASFWLCRTQWGAEIVFWGGPWSACFWALIFHVLVGSRFWRGAWSVTVWRAERGGFVRSHMKSTAVMFSALGASYALEFLYVFTVPPSTTARQLIPLVTYAPVAFTFWRAARG